MVETTKDFEIKDLVKIVTCCDNCGDYTVIDISDTTDNDIKQLVKEKEMMSKPKHKEPTNYEHCCSCCPKLEKENKKLKKLIKEQEEILDIFIEASDQRGGTI